MEHIELEIFNPQAPSPDIIKIINAIGLDSYNSLLAIECIKRELTLNGDHKSHITFQLIKNLIVVLSTQDPTTMHYDIVRAMLNNQYEENKVDEHIKNDTHIVDILARSLVNHCKELGNRFIFPKEFNEIYTSCKNAFDTAEPESSNSDPLVEILPIPFPSEELEKTFELNNMFLWDKIFLEFVTELCGSSKNKTITSLKAFLEQKYRNFKDEQKSSIYFWINKNDPIYISNAIKLLAEVIWEKEVKIKSAFGLKNPPGLTTNVQRPISEMLSPRTEIEKNEKTIQLYYDKKLLGSIDLHAFPSRIMMSLIKGVEDFKKLTAIRLLSFFIQRCYEEKKKGNPDYRILKFPGGATEIAKCLGIKSRDEISNIKTIMLALDHFKFFGTTITSRLISLGICKPNSPYSHQDGYEITVLSPLLPYRIFEEKEGFVIPLLKEPPLIGHRKYHARLYLLQWKIAEEFVKQSVKLSKNGFIEITEDMFKEFLYEVDIPEKMLPIIMSEWTGEDGILKQISIDQYTLKNEQKALAFLKEQGHGRQINSMKGFASARKRKVKKSVK